MLLTGSGRERRHRARDRRARRGRIATGEERARLDETCLTDVCAPRLRERIPRREVACVRGIPERVRGLPAGNRQVAGEDERRVEDPPPLAVEVPDRPERIRDVLLCLRAVAGGEVGLNALKEALSVKPGVAPPVELDLSLARFVPLMGKKQKTDPAAAAQKAFGDDREHDKLHVRLEGGKALKISVKMDAAVLKFFGLMEGKKSRD